MAVAARDVRLAAVDEHIGVAAAGDRVREDAGPHLLSRAERVDRELPLVMAAVRERGRRL